MNKQILWMILAGVVSGVGAWSITRFIDKRMGGFTDRRRNDDGDDIRSRVVSGGGMVSDIDDRFDDRYRLRGVIAGQRNKILAGVGGGGVMA